MQQRTLVLSSARQRGRHRSTPAGCARAACQLEEVWRGGHGARGGQRDVADAGRGAAGAHPAPEADAGGEEQGGRLPDSHGRQRQERHCRLAARHALQEAHGAAAAGGQGPHRGARAATRRGEAARGDRNAAGQVPQRVHAPSWVAWSAYGAAARKPSWDDAWPTLPQDGPSGGLPQAGSGKPGGWVPPSLRSRLGGEGGGGEAMSKRRDENSVRVSNLSEDVTEDDLAELFGPFGPIQRIYVAKDRETGEGKSRALRQRGLVVLNGRASHCPACAPATGKGLAAGALRPLLTGHVCTAATPCSTPSIARRRVARLCLHQLHPPRGRPARHLQARRLRLRQPHPVRVHGSPPPGAPVDATRHPASAAPPQPPRSRRPRRCCLFAASFASAHCSALLAEVGVSSF